ncbi:hypothetical protein TcCL_ESM09086, partial [Trypanosoma cruzi]
CLACWRAWKLRGRPALQAPVRKTVAPLRHAKLRPSPTIGTPGRACWACAVILWTEKKTPQIGREDVNPPLAGRKGFAALTSGRGSGGSRGGPVSSVKKGRHHRHRVLLMICRACAGPSKSGRVSHLRGAATRGTMPGSCQEWSSATPTSACHAVCTTSSSSTSFQYNLLTAARKSTCQILMPHCCRDCAIVPSSLAVLLRGIPQCDGVNINSAG